MGINEVGTMKLARLTNAAYDAAEGDSNDAEIEALQAALEEALILLGREDLFR